MNWIELNNYTTFATSESNNIDTVIELNWINIELNWLE